MFTYSLTSHIVWLCICEGDLFEQRQNSYASVGSVGKLSFALTKLRLQVEFTKDCITGNEKNE